MHYHYPYAEIVSTLGYVITDIIGDLEDIQNDITLDWIKEQRVKELWDDIESIKSPKQLTREIEAKNKEMEERKKQAVANVSMAQL